MDWSTFIEQTFTNFLLSIGFIVVAGLVWILTTPDDDDQNVDDFF
jgi:hypothetical protein